MTGDHSVEPARHYDRVTAAWGLLLGDELHYGVFDTGDENLPVATGRLTDLMEDAADLHPGHRVLDVGCGTGTTACRLATAYGVSVVGITTSGVGVELARERAAASGVPDVTFEMRDGMDNGFPDTSFDRVWVLESSHLMRRRDRLVAECARVTRPSGRLVLCDIVLRRELSLLEVREIREPLQLLRRVFGDARMEPLAAYARWAQDNGLVVDRTTDLTAATRPTFERWRRNAEVHRDRVTTLLGPDGLAEFVAGADVLERFWDDGILGYGLLSAYRPG